MANYHTRCADLIEQLGIGSLKTLRSRRFYGEPVVVEVLRRIPGTNCFLVDLLSGSGDQNAYAHQDELGPYGPDDSDDYEP